MPPSDQSQTRDLSGFLVASNAYKTAKTTITHRKAEEEPRLVRNIPLTQTTILDNTIHKVKTP